MARRKRCTGPCGALYPPERLARVAGRDWLCPDCLLAEAEAIGDATLDAQERDEARYGEAMTPPEPLPLRDEEERFAGMIERRVDGWPLRKGRLSASALGTFLRCPEQFRRSYVLGERRPSGGTGLAGTGAHGAVEAALHLRMASGRIATPKQIVDTYDAVFDAAVERAIDREGIVWGKADKTPLDRDLSRGLGRAAVAAYAEQALPSVDAVEVERVFALDVPGVPVPFVGLIDVSTPRSSIDLKFGGQSANVIKPDWRVQALVYGLADRKPVEFHAASWAGKVTTPRESAALRFNWDARQVVLAARVLRSVVDAILLYAREWGPDEPWPGNITHTWACGACEFRPDCAWWTTTRGDTLL